jgi:hypothetical protein
MQGLKYVGTGSHDAASSLLDDYLISTSTGVASCET